MTERCYYRISIKALIWNEDKTKFLLALEDNGFREFPGGGLEHGEDPVIGISREMVEELGIKATNIEKQPSYFVTAQDRLGRQIANIFYETKIEHLNFTPSDECIELRFVTPSEALEINSFPNVKELCKQLI